MKITVITVCYNAEDKIRDTVESVCYQTYPDIEYLIIDGASTDGTLDIIQKYSKDRNIRIYSEKDKGIYNAMNRGISRASGDFVFFLNAGDIFYNEQVLEEAYSYIKEDMDAIHYGKVCLVYSDGTKSMQNFAEGEGTLEEKLLKGIMPCHQCIFAPRKLLEDHYFRETYKIRADYEWLMYSVSRGVACKNMPIVVSYYDTTGISSSYKACKLVLDEEALIIGEYKRNHVFSESFSVMEKEVIRWKYLAEKHFLILQLMEQWRVLQQKKIFIGEYLKGKNYHHIAVYGVGFIGRSLLDELEGAVTVDYIIDQKAGILSVEWPIYLPDDELSEVDVIIVTAITYFDEIKKKLSPKVICPILSIEDILYEMASK